MRPLLKRQAHEGVSDWIRTYTDTLHALSGLHKDTPVAKQATRVLKSLAREARASRRGKIWLPEPDSNGFFPVIGKIAYPDVSTAIRRGARSETKERAWARIRTAEKPYVPPMRATRRETKMRPVSTKKTLHSQLKALGFINEKNQWLIDPRSHTPEASLARSLMVAFPVAKGRYPEWLGRKVPGNLFRRERGSVLRWDEISPEDVQIGGGFTPMKFAKVIPYARFGPLKIAVPKMLTEVGLGHSLPHARKATGLTLRSLHQAAGVKKLRLIRPHAINRLRSKWAAKGIPLTSFTSLENKLKMAPGLTEPQIVARAAKRMRRGEVPRKIVKRAVRAQKLLMRPETQREMMQAVRRQVSPDELRDLGYSFTREHVLRYARAMQPAEKACFYAGFVREIKEAGLPALSRGALLGLLSTIQQELGLLPAITVDNIPVHRKSFKREFERFGDAELRSLARGLASEQSRGAKKALEDIHRELALRKGRI